MTDQNAITGMPSADVPSELTREALAGGLRRLAGDRSLRDIASATGVPAATLSGTFRANTLPSAATIVRLVVPFGGNADAWVAYRNRIAHLEMERLAPDAASTEAPSETEDDISARASGNAVLGEARPGTDEDGTVLPAPQPTRRFRSRTLVVVAAASLLVGAGAGAGATYLLGGGPWSSHRGESTTDGGGTGTGTGGERPSAKTGDDPAIKAECMEDAITAAASQLGKLYLMELRWSATCNATWGRITRYDDLDHDDVINVVTYFRDDPEGPATQRQSMSDLETVYTNMIVNTDRSRIICTKGDLTADGEVIDMGEPICM